MYGKHIYRKVDTFALRHTITKLQSYSPMYFVCLCMSVRTMVCVRFSTLEKYRISPAIMHTVPFDLNLKQLINNLNCFSERSVKNAGCQVIDEVFSSVQHNSHLCRAGRLCRLSSIPRRYVYITFAHTENLLTKLKGLLWFQRSFYFYYHSYYPYYVSIYKILTYSRVLP